MSAERTSIDNASPFTGAAAEAMRPLNMGAHVPRREDRRLLSKGGRYIGDIELPRMVEVAFVRSPFAHASIGRIDLAPALGHPGVHAAVTARDLHGVSPFPDHIHMARGVEQYPLGRERVRFAGSLVAAVVADDRYRAEDAAELVSIEYEPRPVVTTVDEALDDEAPLLYDGWPDNRIVQLGRDNKTIDEVFASSRVVTGSYTMHRHGAVPLETRGVLAEYAAGRLTIWSSTQQPHIARTTLAEVLGLPESMIRIIVPDIGGGFGAKLHVYPEDAVVAWLAMRLERPVRWIEDRSEHLRSASHSREQRHDFQAAIDPDGLIAAIRCHITRDLGSGEIFPPGIGPALVSGGAIAGPYRIPMAHVSITGVATNKAPSGAYRGYGTPEMVFALERFMEKVAAETGQDSIDFRRRMMIRPEDLPYMDARGRLIDSGSHLEAFERAVVWGEKTRAKHSPADGHRIGVGHATYVEGVAPSYYGTSGLWTTGDGCTVKVEPDGKVTVTAPVTAMGQGTETMMATVTADALGVPMSDVTVLLGDTDVAPYGLGSYGGRSAVVATGGILMAAEELRAKIRLIAAHKLECAAEDLIFEGAAVHVRGSQDARLSFRQVAEAAYFRTFELPPDMEAGLSVTATYETPGIEHVPNARGGIDPCASYSNSSHVAVVDVEVATGVVQVIDYLAVHDCGPLINPEIVEGQIQGGVAQGIGGALYEHMVYSDDGQPLATSLMDYRLPGTKEIPDLQVEHRVSPSPTTPLGIKGAGEAGVTGPIAAIANAVADALSEFGADVVETPLTPAAVRRLIAGNAEITRS